MGVVFWSIGHFWKGFLNIIEKHGRAAVVSFGIVQTLRFPKKDCFETSKIWRNGAEIEVRHPKNPSCIYTFPAFCFSTFRWLLARFKETVGGILVVLSHLSLRILEWCFPQSSLLCCWYQPALGPTGVDGFHLAHNSMCQHVVDTSILVPMVALAVRIGVNGYLAHLGGIHQDVQDAMDSTPSTTNQWCFWLNRLDVKQDANGFQGPLGQIPLTAINVSSQWSWIQKPSLLRQG